MNLDFEPSHEGACHAAYITSALSTRSFQAQNQPRLRKIARNHSQTENAPWKKGGTTTLSRDARLGDRKPQAKNGYPRLPVWLKSPSQPDPAPRVQSPLARIVLDLRCVKCQVKFKQSLEEKRRTMTYTEGEMLRLQDACPDKCGGEWFALEKLHSIRKFKKHY